MNTQSIEMTTAESKSNWKRGFWSVWATQFQESFSDNAYRFLVISFVTDRALHGDKGAVLELVAGILFAAPFVLFSPTGGYLADRYSKRSVILGTKFAEILIMGVALLGLSFGSVPIVLLALFLRGIQSSCYSPSKLGMLPEILPTERLSWGNGLIELGSFMAIICGAVAGPFMYATFGGHLEYAGLILLAATLIGLAVSTTLPHVRSAGSAKPWRRNPFGELAEQWKLIRKDRTLMLEA